ncbi:uncharacterized protein LOC142583680 [Dermacentor variabilis]|uniref:uncharacterized protein LOC142583680 n=1 Tax=Dermacentor variabilis TaxID=34621 RepID=UPI003F5AEF85
MDNEVQIAFQNIIVCQASDKSTKTAVNPLQPVPLPEHPCQKVAINIVSPTEIASHDCRFAVAVVDSFSMWPEAQFRSEVSTCMVTIIPLSVFCREGYPEEIACDNGPQSCSRQFNQFLTDRVIRLSHSSLYYPLVNELVERFSSVFKNFLQTALLAHRPLCPAVIYYFDINQCTAHATTGVAQSLLLLRRLPRTSLDVVTHLSSFFRDLATELCQIRRRVKDKQESSKEL